MILAKAMKSRVDFKVDACIVQLRVRYGIDPAKVLPENYLGANLTGVTYHPTCISYVEVWVPVRPKTPMAISTWLPGKVLPQPSFAPASKTYDYAYDYDDLDLPPDFYTQGFY